MIGIFVGVAFALTLFVIAIPLLLRRRRIRTASIAVKTYDLAAMGAFLRSKWTKDFDANAFIDVPVIYINMDKSLARRQRMIEEFRLMNLKPTPMRLEAVDGAEYLRRPSSQPWIEACLHPLHVHLVDQGEASPGELGCLLSHIKALFYVYHTKHPAALILEDDIDFSCVGLWGESLSSLIRRVPPDWDFIQLQRMEDFCFMRDQGATKTHMRSLYKRLNNKTCYGTAAYLVSKRFAGRFYKSLSNDGLLSEKYIWLAKQQGCDFGSDSVMYNIFPDTNLYLEESVRFLPYNDSEELDSTIHPEHTDEHIKTAYRQMKQYKAKLDPAT